MEPKFSFRLFFATFLLVQTASFAQSISGTLVDKSTQETIPFATVQLGENYGVITNQEGNFSINTMGFAENDSLMFSSMGYETKNISLKDFKQDTVYLTKNVEELGEVLLMDEKLTALEVMQKVADHLEENYDYSLSKFTAFHRSKSSTTPHQMKFDIKKADFIDKSVLREFNETVDSLSDASLESTTSYYNAYLSQIALGKEDSLKVQIEKATELINKKVSNNFDILSKRILTKIGQKIKSANTFKIRTGIIPIGDSLDLSKEFTFEEGKIDSLHTKYVGNELESVLKETRFSKGGSITISIGGSSSGSLVTDYITELDDYEYNIEDVSTFNGEVIYVISFSPDRGLFAGNGRFVGKIYVSADSFAVLKATYQLAEGEHGTKFNMKFLLGVKFVENAKSGTAIFQKSGNGGYIPKYLQVSGQQYMYFSRNFVLKENDKNRNDRMKLKFEITVEADNAYENEWLFTDSKSISEEEFASFEENEGVPVQQLSEYNPDIWKDYNILAPTEAIREYEY